MEMMEDEDEAEAKTFTYTLKISGSYRIVHCSTVMGFAHSTFPYSAFTSDEKHQKLRLTTTTTTTTKVHCPGDSDSSLSPYRRWQRILFTSSIISTNAFSSTFSFLLQLILCGRYGMFSAVDSQLDCFFSLSS